LRAFDEQMKWTNWQAVDQDPYQGILVKIWHTAEINAEFSELLSRSDNVGSHIPMNCEV